MNIRFTKEVNLHKNQAYVSTEGKWNSKLENCFYYDSDENSITFSLFVLNRIILIKIVYQNSYPFKPPKVFINNLYNYRDLLRTSRLFKFYKEYLKFDGCLCCQSILCNWFVTFNFSTIINEVKTNFILKKRLSNIIIAKYVMIKNFGFIIPILYQFI